MRAYGRVSSGSLKSGIRRERCGPVVLRLEAMQASTCLVIFAIGAPTALKNRGQARGI